jgi:hypothetical protein
VVRDCNDLAPVGEHRAPFGGRRLRAQPDANYIKAYVVDTKFIPMFLGVIRYTLLEIPMSIICSLLLAILLLPACCHAEKSAVLVIVDGLGSTYVYTDHSPACVDGSLLPMIHLSIIDNASARYEIQVPEPETEAGNAVIATGYRDATEEMFSYYGATIYDAVRTNGYLSIAIVETGDTTYMVKKPDIIVYEKNNSQYTPCATIAVNGNSIPAGVQDVLAMSPPARLPSGTNPAAAYRQYDEWPLDRAVAMVRFLGANYPEHQAICAD